MPTLKKLSFLSKLTDPYYDDESYTSSRRAQGSGSLIPKSDRTEVAQPRSRNPAASPRHSSDIVPGTLCKNKIGDESCWTVVVDQNWQRTLRIRVDDLIDAQNHNLYKRDRREFDSYMEIFLVGKTLEDARLAMVISCNSETDLGRVQKLLKKFRHVPDYDNVSLMAMCGGPRSTVSLIPLAASGDSSRNAVSSLEQPMEGSTVYGILESNNTLNIPAEVWIGRSLENSHKAVIGGLLSTRTGSKGTKLGLTVAHTTSVSVTDSTNVENRVRTMIGTIKSISRDPSKDSSNDSIDYHLDYLDWALVKFDASIRLRTNAEPPSFIASKVRESVTVNVLAPRGSFRGVLSPSMTYISISGRHNSSPTHAIILDEPIRAGDCGIWVVDLNGSLYGHVAFGHAGDTIAYIIPIEDVLSDVVRENRSFDEIVLAKLGDGSKRQIIDAIDLKKANRDRERSLGRDDHHPLSSPSLRPKGRKTPNGISVHQKWRRKFRKDDRRGNLKFAAWAIGSGSRLAARGRKRQAALMYQTVEEMQEQVAKWMAKHHPEVLETPVEGNARFIRRKLDLQQPRQRGTNYNNYASKSKTVLSDLGKEDAMHPNRSVVEKEGIGDVVPTSSAKQDKFWTQVRKRFFRMKRTPLPSSAPTLPEKSADGGQATSEQVLPVYKYSGDEHSESSDGSDDDLLDTFGKSFMDNFLTNQQRKMNETRSGSRRRRSRSNRTSRSPNYRQTRVRRTRSRSRSRSRSLDREIRYDDYYRRPRARSDYDDYYTSRSVREIAAVEDGRVRLSRQPDSAQDQPAEHRSSLPPATGYVEAIEDDLNERDNQNDPTAT